LTLFRIFIWLVFAIALCWPVAFSSDLLIGDPQIDVWNHAWGYWYVYQSLMEGNFPLDTTLVGAPRGGSLYFIDTPGAFFALPITHFFGAAVAYNWILIIRIALSGLGAQLLAQSLSRRGIHTWLAGIAYASTPFLVCELNNGISEVCAIEWIPFALWASIRVLRTNRYRDWVLLGVMQGLASSATFYYGLASALVLCPLFVYALITRFFTGRFLTRYIIGTLISISTALIVFFPHGYSFWTSIHKDDRLVIRDVSLHDQLLRHNAVDPSIFFTPGNFQSVNLLQEYGEPFVHTGYLRWSIIILSLIAVFTLRKIRPFFIIGLLSLLLGMGSYLWYDGEWVRLFDGQLLSLPFDWLRQILPQIAITHPLRLSIGAQALFCAFAAVGFGVILKKYPYPTLIIPLSLFVVGETLFASAASWPLHTSEAQISDLYEKADQRAVLDLPAEVGTSMKTSRYFWYQTIHKSPIPYTPDVRLGSAKDPITFANFIGSDGFSENPRVPKGTLVEHMKQTYGLIVLHPELDFDLSKKYLKALTPAFGKPKEHKNGMIYWLLEESDAPLVDDGSTTINLSKEETTKDVCSNPSKALDAMKQGIDLSDNKKKLLDCTTLLSEFCLKWSKKSNISEREALLCAESFLRYRVAGDADALIQLLRREEDSVRKAAANALGWRDLTEKHKKRIQSAQARERIPSIQKTLGEVLAR
jgi:hypothetical protein